MSLQKSTGNPVRRPLPNVPIATQRRAKRARDHLALKRKQAMTRLERERVRAATAGNRARTRGQLTPILVLAAFISGVLLEPPLAETFLFESSPFDRLAVQGTRALTPNDVAKTLNLRAGRFLDSVSAREIRQAIEVEPWIESIRSLRLPSGTLVVEIVEREAVARWLMHETGDVEMVDEHGERFPGRIEPGGPLPLVSGSLEDEGRLPESAIHILEELRRHAVLAKDPAALTLRLPVTAGESVDGKVGDAQGGQTGYVLQIGENGPRALLGKRYLRQRIARLAVVLNSEESRLQNAQLIDLRYADRAVLRNEPVSG